jgi:alkanesulfonate monooxygenase SsuD/methylene tetrahydromethanopterin reductase-like flavin-dependent oxidoreductase (luciferase family)
VSPRPRALSGVFLVRVWLEDESLLRARVTETADLTKGRETIALVGSADEVERRLRDWLAAFTDGSEPVTLS